MAGRNTKLSEEVNQFKPASTIPMTSGQYKALSELSLAELRDITQKLNMRLWVAVFFVFLLLAQNIAVFWIVVYSLLTGSLQDLQLILGVLITGTLTQTYLIARIIVSHLFPVSDPSSETRKDASK